MIYRISVRIWMVRTRIVVLALTEGTRVVVRQIDLGIAGWIRRVVIIS